MTLHEDLWVQSGPGHSLTYCQMDVWMDAQCTVEVQQGRKHHLLLAQEEIMYFPCLFFLLLFWMTIPQLLPSDLDFPVRSIMLFIPRGVQKLWGRMSTYSHCLSLLTCG